MRSHLNGAGSLELYGAVTIPRVAVRQANTATHEEQAVSVDLASRLDQAAVANLDPLPFVRIDDAIAAIEVIVELHIGCCEAGTADDQNHHRRHSSRRDHHPPLIRIRRRRQKLPDPLSPGIIADALPRLTLRVSRGRAKRGNPKQCERSEHALGRRLDARVRPHDGDAVSERRTI